LKLLFLLWENVRNVREDERKNLFPEWLKNPRGTGSEQFKIVFFLSNLLYLIPVFVMQ
jgi:hypothetical protein